MSFKLFSAVSNDFQISSDSARKLSEATVKFGTRKFQFRIFTSKSSPLACVSWTRAPDGGSGVEKKGEKKKVRGVLRKRRCASGGEENERAGKDEGGLEVRWGMRLNYREHPRFLQTTQGS